LLQQFSTQVGQIAQIANGVQESLAGAGRVFALIDAPIGLSSPPGPAIKPHGPGEVRFERVSFGYTPQQRVLHEVSLTVKPGQCVAIVGETGSGKSALLSLIPRFYDPESGRVLIDGIDVRKLDLQSLRRHVGFVFQESFLFSDSVAANIAFGEPDAPRERIIAAARIAQAHEFIEALPEGYDTILNEGGVNLSGGQRQRLAIARALLSDPAILVLDDPTAAIDPETEQEILTAIEQASAGRTTFIVANRLSTLQRTDHILVMQRGRIVQSGTHASLVYAEGSYRRAAMHQMIDDESLRLLTMEMDSNNAEPAGMADEAVTGEGLLS
jgi:ATP-binding cassette subfamily B protein